MSNKDQLFTYVMRLADDQLILGHRLSEWCGNAPTLEEEMALANLALDLIGQSRELYSYAGEIEGKGRDEDALAYMRYEQDYANALLLERPNGDFAVTIFRQLAYSAFMLPFWKKMMASSDDMLAAIAAKSVKETEYHLRHSAEWTIRLGDGTEESRSRMIEAMDELWGYTGELFEMDEVAQAMADAGIGTDAGALKAEWDATIDQVLAEATLERPAERYMQTGGRSGRHTEHMGHILCELQYMQRAYPGMTW